MTIEFSTDSAPLTMTARVATLSETSKTQFRVLYKPSQRLEVYGPDYVAELEGNGKLVGLVLATKDQELDKIPKVSLPGLMREDPATQFWSMGYLEGNLHLFDGAGNTRLYSGQEDWADGGYYFNSGYTAPAGGSNRPFAGILRYDDGDKGYATLFRYFNDLSAFRFKNGLHLMFGHGTWQNNFAVKYGTTLYYYLQVAGDDEVKLPPSEYATSVQSGE